MANGQLGDVLRHIRQLVGTEATGDRTDGQLLDAFAQNRDPVGGGRRPRGHAERVGMGHHEGPTTDVFLSLRHMLPPLDHSLVALINDLRERGLEKDVLVVMLGEFGRTPKIGQPGPGHNHRQRRLCRPVRRRPEDRPGDRRH